MLGVTWAFFNQGLFGKQIGFYVFAYFAGLSIWYGFHYQLLLEKQSPTPVVAHQKADKEESHWTVSDTLPKEWNTTAEELENSLKKPQGQQ